jgi:rhodanese-related sulfurtransferase
LSASDLADWSSGDPDLQLVDVRNLSEHQAGIIAGSRLVPLPVLLDNIHQLDPDRPTVVVCASGSRSSVAASLLRARGFELVADVLGGFDTCAAAGMPVTHPQS